MTKVYVSFPEFLAVNLEIIRVQTMEKEKSCRIMSGLSGPAAIGRAQSCCVKFANLKKLRICCFFRTAVRRVCCEVAGDFCYGRMREYAIEVLNNAAEAYELKIPEDSNLLAIHVKRVAITEKDILLARHIRGELPDDSKIYFSLINYFSFYLFPFTAHYLGYPY